MNKNDAQKDIKPTISLYQKSRGVVVILLLSLFVVPAHLSAKGEGTHAMDFMKLSHSVKSESLGFSGAAAADSAAFTLNPASVAYSDGAEMHVQAMQYFEGVHYLNVKAVLPTLFGTIALDTGLLDYGTQVRTTMTDRAGLSGQTLNNQGWQTTLGYALQIDKWSIGGNMKYVSEKLDDYTATAMAADAGVRYNLMPSLAVGAAITNIPLQDARFITQSASLERSVRGGLAYVTAIWGNTLLVMTDIIVPDADAPYWGVGAEWTWQELIQFRGGYTTQSDIGNVSFGVGLKIENSMIDFSYKPSPEFGQSYRIGFGLKL